MKKILFFLIFIFDFHIITAACLAPPAQQACSGGNGQIGNNITISGGQTYWNTGTTTISNLTLSGGTLVVCGTLTINGMNHSSGDIVVNAGAVLNINAGINTGTGNIVNYGIINITGGNSITLQGNPTILYNATTSSHFNVPGSITLNNTSSIQNNGDVTANTAGTSITIQASAPAICMGLGSTANFYDINNNTANSVVAPSGQACVRYTHNATLNQNFSNTANLIICKATGATQSGSGWGSATVSSNCSGCNTVLPIELLYFKANYINKNVLFNWATASEINNNYFTVERSTDGINFVTLSIVSSKASNGNSTGILSYTFSDTNVVSGTYYYRLKQTDFDFKYTYSSVVAVTVTQTIDFTFDLAPNPNDGNSTAGFITTPYNGMVTIKIYNIAGSRLYMEDIQVKEGENNPFKIQFKDRLDTGTYIVIAILNGDLTKKKLMIVSR